MNKKVNYIEKTTAPEVHTYTTNLVNWVNDNVTEIVNEYHTSLGLYERKLINNQYNENGIHMKGDLIRVKNITFYGSFTLSPNRTASYIDVPLNYDIDITSPQTAYLKIIIARLKHGGGRIPERITQDGEPIGQVTGAYKDITPIFGPLVSGIGGQLSIIKQKIIKVNNKTPFKAFKFKLSNKQIGNFKTFENWPESYGRNELVLYVQYLNPASLQKRVGEDDVIISPGCVISINCKMSYVDED